MSSALSAASIASSYVMQPSVSVPSSSRSSRQISREWKRKLIWPVGQFSTLFAQDRTGVLSLKLSATRIICPKMMKVSQ